MKNTTGLQTTSRPKLNFHLPKHYVLAVAVVSLSAYMEMPLIFAATATLVFLGCCWVDVRSQTSNVAVDTGSDNERRILETVTLSAQALDYIVRYINNELAESQGTKNVTTPTQPEPTTRTRAAKNRAAAASVLGSAY